jgi:hypothetical protein
MSTAIIAAELLLPAEGYLDPNGMYAKRSGWAQLQLAREMQ